MLDARRWLRILAGAVAALLLLWGAAWLAVPPLVQSQLQKIASRELGRAVTVGAVEFRPWSLELTLNDLAVATADGKGRQFHLQRLYLNASSESLWRLAPVLDALEFDAPSLEVARLGDGRYDVDDVVARLNAPAATPPGEPLRFALFNVTVRDGRVDFDDRVVGRVQQLRDLGLAVPFLSNLQSRRDVVVRPQLAFTLNGSRFDSTAAGTPFASGRKMAAQLAFAGLDLAPYLGYLPAALPLRLRSGLVDARLEFAFEQASTATLKLSGTLRASRVQIDDTTSAELLRLERLDVVVADLQPLAHTVTLASIELTNPTLSVRRDTEGRIDLIAARAAGAAAAGSSAASAAGRTASPRSTAGPNDASGDWKIAIAKVALRGGALQWADQSTVPPARLALRQITLDASDIALPFARPLQFSGATLLDATGAGGAANAQAAPSFDFRGSATDRQAQISVDARSIPLAAGAPYLAAVIEPRLEGRLSAQADVDWTASASGTDAKPSDSGLRIGIRTATLDDVTLSAARPTAAAPAPAATRTTARTTARTTTRTTARTAPRTNTRTAVRGSARPSARPPAGGAVPASHAGVDVLAGVRRIEITDARADLTQHAVEVGRVAIEQPHALVERDAGGHWMYERWLVGGDSRRTGAPAAASATGGAAAAWHVTLRGLALHQGAATYRDAAAPYPVALQLSALKLELEHFDSAGGKPFALAASARLGSPATAPGTLEFRGDVALAPLAVQGQVQVRRLALQSFAPFVRDRLNVELARADGSFGGRVQLRDGADGVSVAVDGDASVDDLRANSLPEGAAAATAAAPAAARTRAPAVPAASTAAAPPSGTAARAAAPTTAATAGVGSGRTSLLRWKSLGLRGVALRMRAHEALRLDVAQTALSDFYARIVIAPDGRINLQDLIVAPPASSGGPRAAAAPGGPAPIINLGPIALVNGDVSFSDHFIKPNYSADLSQLTGQLGAVSSVTPPGGVQMATLELRGRAQGSAALEIHGRLNPLAKPLALDITGSMRDLDLPPLSPYALKYAGHGIERGKMSADVHYAVKPDGQLSADNRLTLNQLEFGAPPPGATQSLPVKLAVALLADADGVIRLDIPISGSLDDPQFSLGPIIAKALMGIVAKALTAPFELLAHVLGGSTEELGSVPFASGSAVLDDAARAGLDKVAKALLARPALELTVIGAVDPEAEREGYRRAQLAAMVRAEKRRESRAGAAAEAAAAAATVPPATAPAAAAPDAALASAAVPGGAASSLARTAAERAPITLSDAEYPALLRKVYLRADVPKPRDDRGAVKDIAPGEMESLLLAGIAVTDDAMRQLALARSTVVRDDLLAHGVAASRLFLGAPQIVGADAKTAAAWKPHASLQMQAR